MTDERMPLTTAQGPTEVEPDLPLPPHGVPAMPHPQAEEPKPFAARGHAAAEWLVAYAWL
jgi:hypothetical protein